MFPISRSILEKDHVSHCTTKTQMTPKEKNNIGQHGFRFQVKRYLCENPSSNIDSLKTFSYFFLIESCNRKIYLIYISNFHVTMNFYSGEQMLM